MHAAFEEEYGPRYIAGQWWRFSEGGRVKHVQTDGLLALDSSKTLVIIEVKYSHTSDAYFQLENAYIPILRHFLSHGGWKLATCEVVKWYDPHVLCPRRPVLRDRFEDVETGEFAVRIVR